MYDDELNSYWFEIYADLIASNYSWTYEYIEALDAIRFLSLIRVIQKRQAETNLMQAHIIAMVNTTEDGWNAFRTSLGFSSEDVLVKAAKGEIKTSLEELEALKAMTMLV